MPLRYGRCSVVLTAVLCPAAACSPTPQPPPAVDTVTASPPGPISGANPTVTDRDDGQWTMSGRNFAATRHSGLSQITTENVAQLKLAWTFSTGVLNGHEAAPIVVNNTRGVAGCDVVNRGAAFDDGRIFYNTLDNHTVAVDARTGKEVWRTRLGDINKGETMTMAPLVVKGKVLVGNSGGELGVRGWLTALESGTGEVAWRAYNTGPDRDVLIDERFKPWPGEGAGPEARSRFMATVALLAGAAFTLVILALWLPTFFLHPCQ